MLLHAGAYGYPLPTPRLQKVCRFMVDSRADVVICQHSHVAGCYEEYRGSLIVYGQGDLISDYRCEAGSVWTQGFLVKLRVEGSGQHAWAIEPHVQDPETPGVRKMHGTVRQNFLAQIHERSRRLSDGQFIREEWRKYCQSNRHFYYLGLAFGFADSRVFRTLNRRFRAAERLYTRKHLLLLENIVRCESHREILETLLVDRRLRGFR